MEIERQWVSEKGESFHELEEIPAVEMEQFYINITETAETRYRKKRVAGDVDWKYKVTIKNGTGLVREERETDADADEYNSALASKVEGSIVIKKRRTTWRINGFKYEVDEFIEPDLGKIVVEIEFDDEESARGFELMRDVIPHFFKNPVEVTSDERWKLKNVALHGFPPLA